MRLPPALRPLWPTAKRGYTLATRAVAPASMRLSRRRGGWLPQSAVATLDQAVRGPSGGRLIDVRPAEVLERTAPAGRPGAVATFRAQTTLSIRRQAVAELPRGRVLGAHHAVIGGDGAYIDELNRYFGTVRWTEHPLFLHPDPGAPTEITGRLGVLASRGDANYYHFLTDVLPRLVTLERSGVELPERWYVPAATRFQRELLDAMGIKADDVVDAAAIDHVRADVLVVPTVPDLDLSAPPWVTAALRTRLLPADAALVPGRRIYVTRGRARHTRIVRNEDDVLARLTGSGFTVVDPATLSVAEQVRTFAEAEIVVAPHGAALANLAFLSAGAAVVELFAPDFVQGCYWKLADTVPDVRYRYHVGRGRTPRTGLMNGVASDITVDVAVLEDQVRELLDHPAR